MRRPRMTSIHGGLRFANFALQSSAVGLSLVSNKPRAQGTRELSSDAPDLTIRPIKIVGRPEGDGAPLRPAKHAPPLPASRQKHLGIATRIACSDDFAGFWVSNFGGSSRETHVRSALYRRTPLRRRDGHGPSISAKTANVYFIRHAILECL